MATLTITIETETKDALAKLASDREMTHAECAAHCVRVGLTRLAATSKYAKAQKGEAKAKAKKAKARKSKAPKKAKAPKAAPAAEGGAQ